MIQLPDKKYSIIYADPPWSYQNRGTRAAASKHYDTMTIEDIKRMGVGAAGGGIANEDCVLFMWATFPMLREALDVIEAMEASITKIGIDLGLRSLVKLTSKTIEIRWAQDVKLSDGSTKTEGCKAFLRCVSKGIPGLNVDPGNASENEIALAVSRYQLFVAGNEYWLIDQLNTIMRVGGVDYAKDIRSVL